MKEEPTSPILTDNEIDLRELLHVLWGKRWILALCILGSLGLSATYAFIIAKPMFESTALLLPTQPSAANKLGAAAALLGKDNDESGDVGLYQSLLSSRTVIRKLINAPIRNESDTGKGRTEPLYAVMKLDTTKPIELDGAIMGLANSISVGKKEGGEGGLVEIKTIARTPWLAQQIGNSVIDIGQEELRLIRIERSNLILSRLSIAVQQAKVEWDSAARITTQYRDRNRAINLPDQILAITRLEVEKQAKEQTYFLARKEFDFQVLERAKAAPAMMILDPANLPSRKSKPRRSLILAFGLLAGVFGGCIGVIGWKVLFPSRNT